MTEGVGMAVAGWVVVFVVGFGVGSLVRVVVFRYAVPAGAPPRRECVGCGEVVVAAGGVVRPLSVRGRCRWCGVRVGAAPWVAEVVTGLGFVGAPAVAAPVWTAVVWWWLVPFAVASALVDVSVRRLPDRLVGVAGVGLVVILAGVAVVQGRPGAFARAAAAGVVVGVVHLAMAAVGGMGMGDVKLAVVVGVGLGWAGWSCVLVGTGAAFVLAALWVAVALVTGGPGARVPFGPFLIAGACVGLAAGGA
ncbi:prepilin peptidase [Embleya sp. NPDC020630]|uniref:prepilin peptidase n=1 Tax=Embleya sp. NPDC020630 TaxID=3363979 RepID=UPI003791A290